MVFVSKTHTQNKEDPTMHDAQTAVWVALAVAIGSAVFYYSRPLFEQESILQEVAPVLGVWSDRIMNALQPTPESVESFYVWKASGGAAVVDGYVAFRSGSFFLYLTAKPIVVGFYLAVSFVFGLFYEYVLIRGVLSPAAIAQLKRLFWKIIHWQLSLSKEQVALELLCIVVIVAVRMLLGFLQRRRYLRKVKLWIRRKKRQVAKSYRDQVEKILKISVVFGIMMPHSVFVASVLAIMMVAPRFCHYVAFEVRTSSFFYVWYPLVATIFLLCEFWIADDNVKYQKTQQPLQTIQNRTPLYKKKRRKKRQSLQNICESQFDKKDDGGSLSDRQIYWLRYWMVCAAIGGVKTIVHLIPFFMTSLTRYATLHSIVCQLELVFWIWLNIVRVMTPNFLLQYQEFVDPVDILAVKVLGPASHVLCDHVSSIVPSRIWDSVVVNNVQLFLKAICLIKGVTESTAETIVDWTRECRGLVLPFFAMLAWPLQGYGILYISVIVPISKCASASIAALDDNGTSNKRTAVHELQYWVFHLVLSGFVSLFAPVLWWIPLSNMGIFVAYAVLVHLKASTLNHYYTHWIQEELQACDVLIRGERQEKIPFQNSKLAKACQYFISILPKAEGAEPIEIVSEVIDEEPTSNGVSEANPKDDDPLERPVGKENGSGGTRAGLEPSLNPSTTTVNESGTFSSAQQIGNDSFLNEDLMARAVTRRRSRRHLTVD